MKNILEIKLYFIIIFIIAPLIFGGIIYLIWRPTNLIMFHWAKKLGLFQTVYTIRGNLYSINQYIPNWLIYNLPDFLWTFSLLNFFGLIWFNSSKKVFLVCLIITILLSIVTEYAQRFNIVSGIYDKIDILFSSFGIILSLFIITKRRNLYEKN